MGLDMYLHGKRYLSKFFNEDDGKKQALITELFPELSRFDKRMDNEEPVDEVRIEAGYWRKANSIHKWFVNNIQEGEDDCGNYYVSREKLQELKAACELILEDPSRAADKLPTASGFFFGNTEYNEWYLDDLRRTIRIVDQCLELPKEWSFEYHSSW